MPTKGALKPGDRITFANGLTDAYSDADDGGLDIKGWAVTNKRNSYDIIVEPKAFTSKVIAEFNRNPLMLWMHNAHEPIGKWTTARVVPDKGLWVEGHIEPTSRGKDIALLIRRGVLKGLSISFAYRKIEDDEKSGVSTINEVEHLYEVSVVASGVDNRALLQSQYSDVWQRIITPDDEDENNQFNSETKGGLTMPEAPNLSTGAAKEVKNIVDERLEAHQPTLDQYASDIADLKKSEEERGRIIKQYQEKFEQFTKDAITKAELTEYQKKMGGELVELSEKIQRSMNALTLQNKKNAAVYSHWRDIIGEGRHLTDDAGSPLSKIEQKAYAYLLAPINEKVAGCEIIRAIRECNDAVVVADAYMHAKESRNHHITKLRSFQHMKTLIEQVYGDQEFASAMATGNTAAGAEWVPSYLSDRITEYARVEPSIATYFEHWDMRSQVEKWPLLTGGATVYRSPERLVANAEEYKKSAYATADATFTAQNFIGVVGLSTDMLEDSIIAAAPITTRALAVAHNEALEGAIVNGDTTSTHRDTAQSYTTDNVETAFMGLRYHAMDLTTAGYTASAIVGGDATTDFTAAKIRALRAKMGARGVDASKLMYVMGLNAYFQMISFEQVAKPGTYGAQATWLTGGLDSFDGSPIVLTSKMGETLADDGIDDGDQEDNTGLLIVHKPSWKVGHRRGVTVEAEKHGLVQQIFVIATQRVSFQKVAESTGVPVAFGYKINIG